MSETGTPTRDASWRASSVSADLSFLLARSNALSLAAGNEALRPFGLRVRSYPVLALACDEMQGFLISRAIPAEDCAAFLKSYRPSAFGVGASNPPGLA